MSTDNKKFTCDDELPAHLKEKCEIRASAAHAATDTRELNLRTDDIKVPCQNFAVVSFVSPEKSNQKNDQIGMKIRGCFETREEAKKHVDRVYKEDNTFDLFVCDMYSWCLCPPDPEKIDDQEYHDETLNKIISGYKKNQLLAKEFFAERKRELVEQAQEDAARGAIKQKEHHDELRKKQEEELALRDAESKTSDNEDDTEKCTFGTQETISASQLMDDMVNADCCKANN